MRVATEEEWCDRVIQLGAAGLYYDVSEYNGVDAVNVVYALTSTTPRGKMVGCHSTQGFMVFENDESVFSTQGRTFKLIG